MSEYQYYEFQALDNPLSDNDQEALRNISSRARITSTSFINVYNFGDLKADPLRLMEKYFDAFVYVANWGTHLFMLRIPSKLVNVDLAKKYCSSDSAEILERKEHVIFKFISETEDYDWEDGEGYLSSLISLRSDLIRGDYRTLYLAWLYSAQIDEIDEDEAEPPLPADLGNLNASLNSFVDFMRIDKDLIQVAAENSINQQKTNKDSEQLKSWINKLAAHEKDDIIFRLISGNDAHLGAELLHRFYKELSDRDTSYRKNQPRTVREMLQKAEEYAQERRKRIAEQKVREKARKEELAALARENYLNELAKRESETWKKIESLILNKNAKSYDEAVQLLVDLRDLSKKKGTTSMFNSRLMQIREEHSRKSGFIRRLDSKKL